MCFAFLACGGSQVCGQLTQCNPNTEYEYVSPSMFRDRQCKPIG